MLEQMMMNTIRAMGYEPDEFKAMIVGAFNAIVEMRDDQKIIKEKLDRIEMKLGSNDSETLAIKDSSDEN